MLYLNFRTSSYKLNWLKLQLHLDRKTRCICNVGYKKECNIRINIKIILNYSKALQHHQQNRLFTHISTQRGTSSVFTATWGKLLKDEVRKPFPFTGVSLCECHQKSSLAFHGLTIASLTLLFWLKTVTSNRTDYTPASSRRTYYIKPAILAGVTNMRPAWRCAAEVIIHCKFTSSLH